jgi:hypothetical protein
LTPVFFFGADQIHGIFGNSDSDEEIMRCAPSKYEPAELLVLVSESRKINVSDQSSFLKSITVKKRNQTGDVMSLGVLKEVNSWSETGHLQIQICSNEEPANAEVALEGEVSNIAAT